ncbi:alpha/beta fold hydrolase, partial [Acinetobacter baumannii]
MAEAVLDLMDHVGIAKASVVGNSLGGGTGVKLALDHPDRIARLVLMGPGGGTPMFTPMPTEGLGRMQRFYEGDGP